MNSIAGRIAALRERRRDKRVERLGGHPTGLPSLAVESFQPTLNHSERMNDVVGSVTRLGAESVDEATGYPLDNLVNADGIQWHHNLAQQHYAYRARGDHRLREIQGVVEQYWHLYDADLRRLHATEVAVESAMLELSGEPLEQAHVAASPDAATSPAARRRSRIGVSAETDPLDDIQEALRPTHVSRGELRRIFEPKDARRAPHWAATGFGDGTLLGGRPRSTYLHTLALLLAAGADIGAFTQVVELVMPDQTTSTVYLVVAGLTAVVLYIAHMIGAMLRNATAAHPRANAGRAAWLATRLGSGAVLVACTLVWAAIGYLAYWVRRTVPLPSPPQVGGGAIGSGIIGSSSESNPHTFQIALIFLGLYAATGIVAALGAFFTHNPFRGRYIAALRAYRKAAERAAATASQLGRAEASYQRQATELDNSGQVLAEVQELDKAFTEQLKQSVRLQIAVLSKDPAVTDAIFDSDHAPYWPSSNGSSVNGQGPGVPKP
jgi:hypothetical protein